MSSGARVVASDWGWRYAARSRPAVAHVSFAIAPGERVLLLGASGAGKSTLLQGLAGVLGGDDDGDEHGSLTIDGVHPSDSRGAAGLVLQDPESQIVLSRVGDDVAFGCENLGVPRDEIWRRVDEALDAVGLNLPHEHSSSALSGGQKQRLALAGVIAMGARLILLDEPTANLDPDGVLQVRDAVVSAVAALGATLIVVEHRVETWQDVVDRVIVLGHDGVLADGEPDEVFAAQSQTLAESGVWLPGESPSRVSAGPALSEPLLSARDLAIGRGGVVRRHRRRSSAAGVSTVARVPEVSVESGRVLAITGPNGAGKSTLALTMAGLIPPIAGVVAASAVLSGGAGTDPAFWSSRQLLTRIGFVFQDPEHQLLTSSVRAELEIGPRALGLERSEMDARVDELLERLRLTHLATANPFTLSGGEKRRLSVATALATRPRVLLLDEPTFGQDAVTWREMVELIAALRDDGAGIVVVTHDREFVDVLADNELQLEPNSESVMAE